MKDKISYVNNIFYNTSYKKYGISAKGVHWSSKNNQYLRFKVLTSFLKNIEENSIIDVGCGFGEYLIYLEENKIKPYIYLGIDCEAFILELVRKRFSHNQFLNCDILKDEIPTADYLLCSGALNILPKSFFLKAIKNCFDSAKKGFVFNFLTKETIHKLQKDEVFNYCKTLTSKISTKDNYLNNDCTFYLEK